VVPAVTERWRREWGGRSALPPLSVIDETAPRPFATRILHPASVGADRWCNIAGAWARGHRDALVVDLGTANTYDVLTAGVFVGGLIAPGLTTAHEALLRAGARLPAVPFARKVEWWGTTTESAIAAGSWHQGVGGVAQVLLELRARLGPVPVLLTGGLAPLAAADLPITTELLPDLTLEGAAALGPGSP
jgi:type III pantothenate kinase